MDTDTAKTIYGADLKTLVNASSTTAFPSISRVLFIKVNADGSLEFQDWSKNPIITNFTRKTAVGNTTVAGIPCGTTTGNFAPTGCATGASLAPTFTLSTVAPLQ